MSGKRTFVAIALVACLFVVTSCGSKVNQENYDKIKAGMTIEEVEGILGKATKSDIVGAGPLSGGKMTWEDGAKSITVTVANGKSVLPMKSGF